MNEIHDPAPELIKQLVRTLIEQVNTHAYEDVDLILIDCVNKRIKTYALNTRREDHK